MKTFEYERYTFSSDDELSRERADVLVQLLKKKPTIQAGVLSGRFGVVTGTMPDDVSVVIKGYRRGGILRFFVSQYYLSAGKTRAQREYSFLEKARELGCYVPKPLVAIKRGGIFHRNWLVMEEIKDAQTLAEMSLQDEAGVYELFADIGRQIVTLIEKKIFHVDLHPGNVLVDKERKCFLIDFDKAHDFRGTKSALRDKYLCRWRRAVIKHNLPEVLSELLSSELRRKFCE